MEKAVAIHEFLESSGSILRKESSDTQEVLSCIKKLSSDSKNSWMTMCLLSSVLNYCDQDIFEENALVWYKLILKTANSIPPESLLALCFENLAIIIAKGQSIEKLSRELSTKGLEPLLQLLTGSSITVLPTTFHLIETCIDHFPGPCGRFRKNIESLIVKEVNCKDPKVSKSAICCSSRIPLCGSGGEKHVKHIENWFKYLKRILKTIYTISSDLANSNSSFEDTPKDDDSILLPIGSTNEFFGLPRLAYLNNLLLMLESLLTKSTQFIVQLPITLLVTTFCEVGNLLQIDFEKLTEFISEPLSMKITLDKVISSLMLCIQSSCLQFSSLLAPYTNVICKLLVNTISSPFTVSKRSCYGLLSVFVEYLLISPVNTPVFSDLVNFVCIDIQIQIQSTTEEKKISTEKNSKGKKKNRQSKMLSQDIASSQAGKTCIVPRHVVDNTLSALQCTHSIIVNVGSLCKPSSLELIISRLFVVCKQIIHHDDGIINQYTEECQLQLFKVLNSIAHLFHAEIQAPVPIILSIFSNMADHSNSSTIASHCRQYLINFDKVIHNAAPELRMEPRMAVVGNEEVEELASSTKDTREMIDKWTQSEKEVLQEIAANGSTPVADDSPIILENIQSSIVDAHASSEPQQKEQLPRFLASPRQVNASEIPTPMVLEMATQTSKDSLKKTPVDSNGEQLPKMFTSPRRLNANQKLTPDVLEIATQTSIDSVLKIPADCNSQNEAVHMRNSDSGTLKASIPPMQSQPIGSDKQNVVIVESSEEEEDDAPAIKRVKRGAGTEEDVDFEMNLGKKGESEDPDFDEIISTFCEV